MKIHACQMSEAQKSFIRTTLTNMFKRYTFSVSRHAQEKMDWCGVDRQEVAQAIAYGAVIEFRVDGNVFAAVRCDVNGRAVCVSVCLTDKVIVTVWCNGSDDNHRTLDLSAYNRNLDVHKYLKGL